MSSCSRLLLLLLAAGLLAGVSPPRSPHVPASPRGERLWVFFLDKGDAPRKAAALSRPPLNPPRGILSSRALERRQRRGAATLVDRYDLPVASSYRAAVAATGARPLFTSRWLNAVSVEASADERRRIEALPFVASTRPVRSLGAASDEGTTGEETGKAFDHPASPAGPFYGAARQQIEQLRLDELHARGLTGQGVVVAVIDTGFERRHAAFNHPGHPLEVVAEWDFMDDDDETGVEEGDGSAQHHHGTMVLAVLAGYAPGDYVGAAYDASYILVKAEDHASEYEAEEDWFVAGLEFAEARGADVVSSSIVAKWYEDDDLDGHTSLMARAVNVATMKGVHVVQGAGNSGHDEHRSTRRLRTPADAPAVIAVGAVDSAGRIAGFSSDGPTVDGRVKPEVLARGARTATVDPTNERRYTKADGTSLAAPLVAGVVACLVEAHPDWTVAEMRAALFTTARRYVRRGKVDRSFVHGYGLVDAVAAHEAHLCTAEERLTASSADDGLTVVVEGGVPYALHTLRLDGDPESDREVLADEAGTSRVLFPDAGGGRPRLELLQCQRTVKPLPAAP